MRRRRHRVVAVLICVVTLQAGAHAEGTSAASPANTLTVFAAASLTAAFQAVGSAFEKGHPGTHVQFNFAGSPTLVQQIQEGAPADVFASADETNMQKLVAGGHVAGVPQVFARNQLEIVVAAGNPKHISGLADLGKAGIVVALCGPTVPAGRYAAEAFGKAGVAVPPASQEPDVKAVVAKVALGEADAGVVYVTDVRAGGKTVEGIELPAPQHVLARYPIAGLKDAQHPDVAQAFLHFVLSPSGQEALSHFGFLAP